MAEFQNVVTFSWRRHEKCSYRMHPLSVEPQTKFGPSKLTTDKSQTSAMHEPCSAEHRLSQHVMWALQQRHPRAASYCCLSWALSYCCHHLRRHVCSSSACYSSSSASCISGSTSIVIVSITVILTPDFVEGAVQGRDLTGHRYNRLSGAPIHAPASR